MNEWVEVCSPLLSQGSTTVKHTELATPSLLRDTTSSPPYLFLSLFLQLQDQPPPSTSYHTTLAWSPCDTHSSCE
ncbi:hypothetical protein Pcinc_019582 [Petrolisthes cinctipes]|uniref:Uncharacterized protein n=1 Tax=Petrolisthes cinctipes TaxID=88211 RepID=A0AAE1FJS3_PETCI|nr:hypothetical protein Pcinc_019582 [Petrolisthes cinctipes]